MAQTNTVLTDARIEINSVVHSDGGNSVNLGFSVEKLPATTFGTTTVIHEPGLIGTTCTINFQNDFTDNLRDELFFALLRSKVAIKIRLTSASIGAANPEYQWTGFIESWTPFSNSIGQIVGGQLTIANSSAVTRAVA